MSLFSILFKLGVDGSQFEAGMKRAQSSGKAMANGFRKEVGGQLAAAFSVGAIVSFGKHVMDVGDQIADVAKQLNITAEQVQTLQALAGQTGVKFEVMAKAIERVNGKRLDAIETDGAARESFSSLGISVAQLNNGSLDNIGLLELMGQGHLKAGRNAETQAAMVDLPGMETVHAANAIAKIHEMGPIKLISDQDLKDLGQLADTVDQIKRDVVVSMAPEVSFWGRAAKRAAADDAGNAGGLKGIFQSLFGKGSIVKAAFQEVFQDQSELNERFPAEPLKPRQVGTLNKRDLAAKKKAVAEPQLFQEAINLGTAQDPLSRIGGFTSFGASQDRVIQQLQEQVRQLSYISRNTEETARTLKD